MFEFFFYSPEMRSLKPPHKKFTDSVSATQGTAKYEGMLPELGSRPEYNKLLCVNLTPGTHCRCRCADVQDSSFNLCIIVGKRWNSTLKAAGCIHTSNFPQLQGLFPEKSLYPVGTQGTCYLCGSALSAWKLCSWVSPGTSGRIGMHAASEQETQLELLRGERCPSGKHRRHLLRTRTMLKVYNPF